MKTGIDGKLCLILLMGLLVLNAGCSKQLHTALMSSDDNVPWSLASLSSFGNGETAVKSIQSKADDGLPVGSSDQKAVSDYLIESPPLPRIGHSDSHSTFAYSGQPIKEAEGQSQFGDDSMFNDSLRERESNFPAFGESESSSPGSLGLKESGGLSVQGRLLEGESQTNASDFLSSSPATTPDEITPLNDQDLLTEMAAASGTSEASGNGFDSISSRKKATGISPLGDELLGKGNIGDVFFDFDAATLRSDAESTLQVNAQILKTSFENRGIVIEGHCDERGTAEYNLVLGERRAQSTKQYLVDLGVSSSTIQTISYGKEKPFCHASQPDCWKKNRRGHFVLD